MPATETMTIRLSAELKRRLEKLAEGTERTKSHHAAAAIEDYVARNAWQIEAIHEGIAAADAGRLVDDGDVGGWIRSLAADKPLPRPRAKR